MDSFDAHCKFVELTTSSYTFSIPGRVRLNCFFYTRAYPTTSTATEVSSLTFYNGSSASGPVLYKHFDTSAYDPPANPCYTMPGDGLLFDNGLFFSAENDSHRKFGCVTLIYSGS